MMIAILRRMRREDDGIAIALVIGIGAAITILVVAMLTFSTGDLVKSNRDVNWNDALSAAYAGVEDYQSKLANDNAYPQYGNSAAPFSSASSFTGTNSNPAFGTGTTGTWQTVPTATAGAPQESYRYEVDNSNYGNTGVLRIRSTGRSGNVTRSVVADLKQNGFINYLYFTNYELADPSVINTGCPVSYYWTNKSRASNCWVQFTSSDVINGPVHSNDTIDICGATFNGTVDTAYNAGNGVNYYQPSGCPSATFAQGAPTYSPVVAMPQTNTSLKQETRSDLTNSTVPRPGCLYTGPTSITWLGNGYMTVRSPWTIDTNIAGNPPTSGSVNPQCGTPGANGLGSATGQKIADIANNLIYVQTVPTSSSDPNYYASNQYPAGMNAQNSCLGAGGQQNGNGIGYPISGEATPSTSTIYGCRNGDAFVQGTMDTSETVAADNYVYVVGDITYANSQTNILGLVGQNAVWVYNPVNSNGNVMYPNASRTIDAAILSVAHTFTVQNYASGLKGTLTVSGSIAQYYRGLVGTVSGTTIVSGYRKNYLYDPRFRYEAPPKFLSPVSTTYGVTEIVEVKTAYNADGSPAS